MHRLGWIALSGVAHGVLAYALSTLEWDPPRTVQSVPLEVAILDAQPAGSEPQPPESTAAVVAPRPVRPAATRSKPVVKPAPPTVPDQPAAAPLEPAPASVPSATFILPSARAAALSTFGLESGAIDAGVETVHGPLRDARERALESAVMEAARKVDTIPDPVLHPLSGGGYRYSENGFVAVIETDGSVHMADNFRHAKFIFRPSSGDDGLAAGLKFFATKFDIFKRIDRALGNDPFQSERRWFLDRTRPLREAMLAHYLDQRVHSRRDE